MKMDGPAVEHSDSDSGDSWTLLENSTYADDAPDFPGLPSERPVAENHEKDEDTDGISIISDSEPDSPSPCQLNYETIADEHCPSNQDTAQYISVDQPLHNFHADHESIREDDILGDNGQKHKTYVHRRNKRLSTVLNIVVMASVITAAGVAIGHMWGAKTDCTLHNTPGMNKILSNLYRLQEENAYLRSKLKECTMLTTNNQVNHHKAQMKQNRCKKVFEESLNNNNDKKPNIICLDDRYTTDQNIQKRHESQLSPEKKFIGNVKKLSYSDSLKANINIVNEDNFAYKKEMFEINNENVDKNLNKRESDKIKASVPEEKHVPVLDKYLGENKKEKFINPQTIFEESIDILQVEKLMEPVVDVDNFFEHNVNIINKQDSNKNDKSIGEFTPDIKVNYNIHDRKLFKKYNDNVFVPKGDKSKQSKDTYGMEIDSFDEENITKDNRYTGPKQKQDKKKYDRHKSHKKDKRRNKYEKWEMKGGYLKDYDDISFASSQDSEFLIEKPISKGGDFVIVTGNDLDQCSDSLDDSNKSAGCYMKNQNHKKEKENDPDWFNKRAVSRKEARRLLEKQMFDEVPNTAGWHFRRMRKREQCRTKGDNSTNRKLSKRFKNYKTKQ